MPLRAHLAVALATLLAIAAAGIVILGGDDETRAEPAQFSGAIRPPGIPPADFRLRDQDGKVATLEQYRGQVVVVTFLSTHCKNACALAAQQIRGALDDLGRDVPVLAISVDPPNDTARSARSFLGKQQMKGRIRFLLSPTSQLRRQWKAYGIRRRTQKEDGSAYVVLLDRRGVQRIGFPVSQLTPEGLAHDLRVLEREPRAAGPAAP